MYISGYLNVSIRIPEAKFAQVPLLHFEVMARCPVCKSTADIHHFGEIRPDHLRDPSELQPYQLSYNDETGVGDLPAFTTFTRFIIGGLARKRTCESCGVNSQIPQVGVLRLRRQS